MTKGIGRRVAAWTRSKMPTREQMEANRFIRPYAHRVLRSELWRFTRRSVPRGVALGIATLVFMVGGSLGSAVVGGETFATLAAKIRAGNAYINVHTPANPGGEIRGQLVAQ